MSKTKKCQICENEIAQTAKVCPSCGGKQKKPIYKKWWLWAIVTVIIISVINSSGTDNNATVSNSKNQAEENITYEQVSVEQLIDELNSNAMAAEEKYNNKYLEINGKLSNIDSDGKYISIAPSNDSFAILSVQCYLKNDAQKEHVKTLSKGDILTIKVKIKSIGEIMGYQADIIEF